MKKILPPLILKSGKWFRKRYPQTYLRLFNPIAVRAMFGDERKFLSGRLNPPSTASSVFFFTSHKCASVYVYSILTELTKPLGLMNINLEGYYIRSGTNNLHLVTQSFDNQRQNFQQGYFLGPFRQYFPLTYLETNPIILILRDPRDVVTSFYFSMRFSHGILNEENIRLREEAESMDINDYVLKKAVQFRSVYEEYIQLKNSYNVLFTPYSFLVSDFARWLDEVSSFLGIQDEHSVLADIRKKADFSAKGDVNSHKRQVYPGDFRRQLRPKTIDELNLLFKTVLDEYGFK